MARRRGSGDSNLFAINHDVIRSVLEEANQKLLRRRDELLAALQRAPEVLTTPADIEKTQLFLHQLGKAISETREARLSDGRPLRAAALTVRKFFVEIEEPLKLASQAVKDRLTRAALKSRPLVPNATFPPIAVDFQGEVVISAEHAPVEPIGQPLEIQLDWCVESVDLASVDLESLRHYFTEASVLAACRKHLAANGPNKIAGVSYKEIAAEVPSSSKL